MAARSEPIGAAGGGMFGFAAANPLAPELERRRFQVLPHQRNHFLLGKSELKFNRLEGGTVLPGHLNNPVQIFAGERCQRSAEQVSKR